MLDPIIISYKLVTSQLLYLKNTYKPKEILLTIYNAKSLKIQKAMYMWSNLDLSNIMHLLNGIIPLIWLNLSMDSLKVNC